MSITTEQKRYLSVSLEGSGFVVKTRNGVQSYFKEGSIPATAAEITEVEAIIATFDPLPHIKKLKIAELKAEGLSRIQLIFPAINDFDELDLVREQYLSIVPAARAATVQLQELIDTVQAGNAARQAINALTTVTAVEAYDVVTTPVWP